MKKQFINKKLITCGMTALLIGTMLTGKTMATETKDYTKYPTDVTPPWGRISIVGATEVNSINYVDRETVTVQIVANDDMCEDNEISYYISTSKISKTDKITEWKSLKDGNTVEIDLPSTTSTNTIYAVFKDYNGNTSLIYTRTNQTVTYDANEGTNAPTGGTRIIGAPFVITNQTPEREGYYFLGWSTDPNATGAMFYAGDIIPAEMIIGEGTSATLYAVWTTNATDLRKLSNVVKVGDYVNYPVYYDNVGSAGGTSYIAKRNGWRVLSVEDDGTVNLVSAGVPLTYYHNSNSSTSITNLAINFLETAFTTSGVGYRTTGFSPYKTLTEVFTNKYTATYGTDTSVSYPGYNTTLTGTKIAGTPKVRAMTKEDLDEVYGGATARFTYVNGAQYNDLLAVPATRNYAYTWLASAYTSEFLWYVYDDGGVNIDMLNTYGVRPVVSLKSEVQVTGTDMIGAWNITISE